MDAVLEVAVIGVPDATTGEAVRAYVVPNPEHGDSVDVASVIAHCKQQLTSYKVPKQVEVRDELPKSPVGKVLRKDLKAEALAAMNTRS
jgi:long-chain acyl-CoA synthetase